MLFSSSPAYFFTPLCSLYPFPLFFSIPFYLSFLFSLSLFFSTPFPLFFSHLLPQLSFSSISLSSTLSCLFFLLFLFIFSSLPSPLLFVLFFCFSYLPLYFFLLFSLCPSFFFFLHYPSPLSLTPSTYNLVETQSSLSFIFLLMFFDSVCHTFRKQNHVGKP